MDDSIMNKKLAEQRRDAIVAVVVLVVVILVVGGVGILFLGDKIEFVEGEAEAHEFRVSSKVPGRILKFYVEEGEWVRPGDTLVALTAPDVEAKLEQVEALKAAAEALNEKSHSPARPEVVQAAYEMWQKAMAGRDVAEKTYQRVNRLFGEGVMTAQQHDEAWANLQAMKATEQAAMQQYEMARRGAQWEDKEITAAQVREAQGGVNEVESYVKEMVLVAPVAGEVSDIFPLRGELVGSGAPLMNIALMDDLWISFHVREDHLLNFPIGREFEAYSPALEEHILLRVTSLKDMGTYAAWKATKVTGEFDLKTFEVKSVPLRRVDGLRPGMSLVVELK